MLGDVAHSPQRWDGSKIDLRSKVRVVVVLTLVFGVGFILERKSEKGGICAKSSTKVNGKRRLKIRMASRPINWSLQPPWAARWTCHTQVRLNQVE